MLVLSRKTEQEIQIGPDITIKILQVKGQTVRVGIVAPRDISVMRTELAQRLRAESVNPAAKPAGQKSRGPAPKTRAANPRETSKQEANSLKRILRCRVSRADSTPLSSHLPPAGPASLLSRTAPAPLLATALVAHCS